MFVEMKSILTGCYNYESLQLICVIMFVIMRVDHVESSQNYGFETIEDIRLFFLNTGSRVFDQPQNSALVGISSNDLIG